MPDNLKYDYRDLIRFASELLKSKGLEDEKSEFTATTLVEADLMGHSTHGLYLLSTYVREVESGGMTISGNPEIIRDSDSAITWDGRYLPGPWLVHRALDLGFQRMSEHPVVTIVIRKSHHIGCLAAYPELATKKGLIMILACSDPHTATVAPFGGKNGLYSPNPIAAGFPTREDPIIFDISTSATANGTIMQKLQSEEKLGGQWLQKHSGEVTDDPYAYTADPPATILPLGGLDSGYKGFALGLLIEAITGGLAGHGRADSVSRWGGNVFLQLISPEAFGGKDGFIREISWLADQCLISDPVDPEVPVRLPGGRALRLREEQKENGLMLHPSILPQLAELAQNHGIELPAAK